MTVNTGFYSIFKGKLDKQIDQIKEELQRAKSDRRKEWLQSQIRQTKKLRESVRAMEKAMGKTTCPHCGGEITL